MDQSNSANTDIPITFGQVFAVGDVPAGMSVNIVAGTTILPTQVDIKATHPDGSLRHAVISSKLPTLGAGQSLATELVAVNAGASGAAVSAADLLATNFDAVIELTLDGVIYTASARDALVADSSKRWLEGSLATEFTLKSSFAASNGSTHPHLMARFDVRAYQGLTSVRVDAIVENTWLYIPDPSNFTYDARVLVSNQEVYSITQLKHYRRARWHKIFWWGVEPEVYSKLDVAYLQWKAKYPLQRMSLQDSGYCWVFGAAYTHALGPDTSAWNGNPDNWFQTLSQVYQATFTNNYWTMPGDPGNRLIDKPCGSTEMAAWLTTRFDRPYATGEMVGTASSSMGYPANLQPALAVLVDAGITDSNAAWARLVTSASRPNYSYTPQFAVTPRTLNTPDSIFINGFED